MPRISEESIRKVAEAHDIVQVIGGYISLKRAGSLYKALCPFHKEKTPSFTVNPARQSFHCFGCGAGGGVIRFVMDYEHLPFQEAVRKLARQAGIVLVEESGSAEQDSGRSQRARLLALNLEAADWFHWQLRKNPDSDAARAYLRSREISSQIAANWLLGHAPAQPGQLIAHAKSRGYSQEELVAAGLCGRAEETGRIYERFRDRVMIPIHNDYGEVVGFSGRVLAGDKQTAKYVNSPETPVFTKGRLLFGLHKSKRALISAGEAIVCEGQFDLIMAFERGVENVVAPQGTAFTAQQAAILRRLVSTVILCFDSDAAGEKAAVRSLPALFANGLAVRVLELPEGDDPDSLIRRAGAEDFLRRARESAELFDVLLAREEARGVHKSPATVAAAARRFADMLALIPDAVLREASANRVAARLRVPPRQLHNLLRTSSPNHVPDDDVQQDAAQPEQTIEDAAPLPEGIALLARLAMHSLEVREYLREECADDPAVKSLPGFVALNAILQSDFDPEHPSAIAGFLATCPSDVQRQLSSLESRFLPGKPVLLARSALHGIRRDYLIGLRDSVKARLLTPGISSHDVLQIQKELLDLQKRLHELPPPAFVETSE